MAPAPAKTAAHALRRVFSAGYADDDPQEWDDGMGEGLVRDNEDEWGGGAEALQRVSSRVQSNADGSAEAVLSADILGASRSRSGSSHAAAADLEGSLPLSRAKSTPHASSAAGGPGNLSYAMRRVFSRDESSEWNGPEAEGLVHHGRAPPANRMSSRVSSRVSSHVSSTGGAEEEGAELVLDEEYDDVDIGADNNDIDEVHTASSLFRDDAKRSKRVNRKGSYKLRRFLSTPGKKKLTSASALERTKSYDAEGHDESFGTRGKVSPLYGNEGQNDSSQLSSPIGLRRALSFRQNRSHLASVDKMLKDDDLSTVAESVDTSSLDSPGRKPAGGRFGGLYVKDGKKRRVRPVVVIAIAMGVVAALALAGVGVYLTMGKDEDASSNSQMQYTDLGNSGDVKVLVLEGSADGAWGDEDFGEVPDESSDEDGTWASRDDNEASQGESGSNNQAPDPSAPVPSASAAAATNAVSDAIPPRRRPTSNPTGEPTPPPTAQPTASPTKDTYTKFYLMADCPYDDNERENLMPDYIDDLSSDAEFLVHLGDLQYAKVDDCEEYAYRSASKIMKRSPVPAFVLPGDNDINDCDDHEHGEEMWLEYFHKLDEEWDHDFDVTRWGKLDESFSFLHKGVLYFGLNIVGGSPYSKTEKKKRHAEHLEHIHEIMEGLDNEDFQVVVLLGHADPGDNHDDFFKGGDGFAAIVEDLGKPTIHFHGDWHEYYEVEGDFGVDNYMRISLDGESIAPPIKVEIDVSKKNPIKVSRRDRDLDVDCCRRGWPRHNDEL
ncbi:hypothetical protein ACHAXT_003382 [Thalassiosira profunda]